MDEARRTLHWCEGYIRQARPIGVVYSIAPTLLSFAFMFSRNPFRSVYILRLALALIGGGIMGAVIHRCGVSLWLGKHRSPEGPATALDGALIGASVGFGAAMITPLTMLIGTNHLETAKWFIICYWLGAFVVGAVVGGSLASVGRTHLGGAAKG